MHKTNSLLKELSSWAVTAREIEFNPEIKAKLGPHGHEAELNSKQVQVLVFRYTSHGHLIAGYLVAPRKVDHPLPVIIYNRGGTKDFGLVRPGILFTHIATLAQWGYTVIGSQYPGNSLSEGHDEWGGSDLDSVLELHSLIQGLTCADANRIGMFGESRGGMMTYQCLARVNWIKAAVTLAGAANLVRNAQLRPEMQRVFDEAFGGSLAAKQERSALFWPEALPDVPLLLMHGTADKRVSPLDSIELGAKLAEHNKPFQLEVFEGGDHGLHTHKADWQAHARGWFERFL